MYKIFKPTGRMANIAVINTETHSSMGIGHINTAIVSILTDAKCEAVKEGVPITNEWEFEIDKDTANKLCRLALKTDKTIKIKSDKPKSKKIDAMDVLLGLANFS